VVFETQEKTKKGNLFRWGSLGEDLMRIIKAAKMNVEE
jgi:hypothetical protein